MLRAGLLAFILLVAACGDTGAALSGATRGPLVTPTPPPSPTPYDCGQLPAPKCEVMRRVEQDHRDAIDRWQALAERSYVPILGVTFVDSSPRTTLPPSTPSPSPEPSVRACAAADLVGALGGTNGAGGTSMQAVVVANRGESPCGLKGRPTVRILAGTKRQHAQVKEAMPKLFARLRVRQIESKE